MPQEPQEQHEPIETDVRESDPNASGPQGLAGGMGVSSERTGPDGTGVESTGTHGSATGATHGVSHGRGVTDEPADDEHELPAPGAEQLPGVEHRPGGRRSADFDDGTFGSGLDRTVGESNPAEVPAHEFDRTKNPGHSHG